VYLSALKAQAKQHLRRAGFLPRLSTRQLLVLVHGALADPDGTRLGSVLAWRNGPQSLTVGPWRGSQPGNAHAQSASGFWTWQSSCNVAAPPPW